MGKYVKEYHQLPLRLMGHVSNKSKGWLLGPGLWRNGRPLICSLPGILLLSLNESVLWELELGLEKLFPKSLISFYLGWTDFSITHVRWRDFAERRSQRLFVGRLSQCHPGWSVLAHVISFLPLACPLSHRPGLCGSPAVASPSRCAACFLAWHRHEHQWQWLETNWAMRTPQLPVLLETSTVARIPW